MTITELNAAHSVLNSAPFILIQFDIMKAHVDNYNAIAFVFQRIVSEFVLCCGGESFKMMSPCGVQLKSLQTV